MITVNIYGLNVVKGGVDYRSKSKETDNPTLNDIAGDWELNNVDFGYGTARLMLLREDSSMFVDYDAIRFVVGTPEDDEVFALCETLYHTEYFDTEYGMDAEKEYVGAQAVFLSRNIRDIIGEGIKGSACWDYDEDTLWIKKIRLDKPIRYKRNW